MMRLISNFAAVYCLLAASSATAHELWLDTEDWQVPTGTEIEVQVINGEDFAGAKLAYFPNRVTRFEILQNGETIKVGDRAGDVPALVHNAQDAGLMIIAYETKPSRITYKEWEKFTKFAEHKDFGDDIGARHDATGAPREGFAEAYTRHAKALVA
ncbi:MAG: DUF4198 domain-containing protein, partial [Rhodobacteraceae bacterium]|nr:DUF4198 domain-containing protein [Paracoccaceae bacterium]